MKGAQLHYGCETDSRGTAVASILISAPQGPSLARSLFGLLEVCSVAGEQRKCILHSAMERMCHSGSKHRGEKKPKQG